MKVTCVNFNYIIAGSLYVNYLVEFTEGPRLMCMMGPETLDYPNTRHMYWSRARIYVLGVSTKYSKSSIIGMTMSRKSSQ